MKKTHITALIFALLLTACGKGSYCKCTQQIIDNGEVIATGGPWIEEEPCDCYSDTTRFGDHVQIIKVECK